ncbi:Type IV pilus biogenesis protein PilN [gamma proteobacterium IMCC1989]|nr:Type IV pilus biogenesis protein PilN [gamma proteobacterium IMCC1989]
MATINLLPWRDEYRQERKREFFSILILLAILSCLVGYVWFSFMSNQLEDQQARNAIFTKELNLLDAKVGKITLLKAQRKELESRTEVIQGLQNKRPLIVHYFDQIVRAVPDGVYFKRLSRAENIYTISGISESNTRVSTLMRNLDESPFFASPNLINVVKESFELTVETVIPPDFANLTN